MCGSRASELFSPRTSHEVLAYTHTQQARLSINIIYANVCKKIESVCISYKVLVQQYADTQKKTKPDTKNTHAHTTHNISVGRKKNIWRHHTVDGPSTRMIDSPKERTRHHLSAALHNLVSRQIHLYIHIFLCITIYTRLVHHARTPEWIILISSSKAGLVGGKDLVPPHHLNTTHKPPTTEKPPNHLCRSPLTHPNIKTHTQHAAQHTHTNTVHAHTSGFLMPPDNRRHFSLSARICTHSPERIYTHTTREQRCATHTSST